MRGGATHWNSTYGALLNEYFRWYDRRMGASVTLSGRVVSKHMIKQTNKELLGKYEFGPAIIYGDTDSVYFTLKHNAPKDVDEAAALADAANKRVNASIGEFVEGAFFTDRSRNTIQIDREFVASRGLFKGVKKRYALWVVDKEGSRKPFMKTAGMDNRRTEIPKPIRKFLGTCMEAVIRDRKGESDIRQLVTAFQQEISLAKPWTIGSYSSVSNVELGAAKRKDAERDGVKARLHHAVTAADNTNRLIDFVGKDAAEIDYIRDGDRLAIFKLLQDPGKNPLELKTIALPLDVQPPPWFRSLPFDVEGNLESVLYKKLDLTFDGLGWNVRPSKVAADEMFG